MPSHSINQSMLRESNSPKMPLCLGRAASASLVPDTQGLQTDLIRSAHRDAQSLHALSPIASRPIRFDRQVIDSRSIIRSVKRESTVPGGIVESRHRCVNVRISTGPSGALGPVNGRSRRSGSSAARGGARGPNPSRVGRLYFSIRES